MSESNAEQITQAAKSNLAFTFAGLEPGQKYDITVFYAFCRIIDDIADEIGPPPEEKYRKLDRWVELVRCAPDFTAETTIEKEVIHLLGNEAIEREAMLGIIEGCRSDVTPRRYETIDDLKWYTYRVASCVGIVTAALFGASRDARDFGIALGHSLQLTNILRDVGEDWHKEHRIYLPMEDLASCGYSEDDLRNSVYNNAFLNLARKEAERAEAFYMETDRLYSQLSFEDRRALAPAIAMKMIYHDILEQMKSDQFRVFSKRYRVSKWRKAWLLFSARRIARKKILRK